MAQAPTYLSESPFSTLAAKIEKSIAVLGNEDTTTEDAFRIIDQEVNKHKTCIVALLKRRNTFAPISRLPPEILCNIFHFTIIDAPTRYPQEWIKVSHVSHAWRNTAVNTPSLWTKLPIYNSQWTNEMLSRSKEASLSVDASFNDSEDEEPELVNTLSSVLRHASRIRHLHIRDAPFTSMQKIFCDLPKATPRLESLCLRSSLDEAIFWQAEATEYELPAESLCDASRLSELKIEGLKINWDTHLLSSLTSLKIQNNLSSSRPTTTQFWDALKRMPYLEYLDLYDTFPVTDEATLFSSHEPIRFERLQQLTLHDSAPQVELFLKGISYLPTVITKVSCEVNASGSDFTGPLSAVLSIILPSAKSGGLDIFKFHLFGSLSFRIYSNAANDVANLEFTPFFTELYAPDEYLKNVVAAMPLGNLTELHLSSTGGQFSPEVLAENFGILPHLHSVHTTHSYAQNFLNALQKMKPNANEGAPHSVYFPNLRTVSMRWIYFSDESITVHMLEDALIWRYEMGAEVQELHLDMCSRITAEEVDHLRHIVVDVEWDEGVMGFTDNEDSASEDYERDEYDDYSDDGFY